MSLSQISAGITGTRQWCLVCVSSGIKCTPSCSCGKHFTDRAIFSGPAFILSNCLGCFLLPALILYILYTWAFPPSSNLLSRSRLETVISFSSSSHFPSLLSPSLSCFLFFFCQGVIRIWPCHFQLCCTPLRAILGQPVDHKLTCLCPISENTPLQEGNFCFVFSFFWVCSLSPLAWQSDRFHLHFIVSSHALFLFIFVDHFQNGLLNTLISIYHVSAWFRRAVISQAWDF